MIEWPKKSRVLRYLVKSRLVSLMTAVGACLPLFQMWSFRGRNFRISFLSIGSALFCKVFNIDKFPLSLESFKYQFAKLALRLLPTWTLSGMGTNRASWGSTVPFSRFSIISVIDFLLPSSWSLMQARMATPTHFSLHQCIFCTFVRKGNSWSAPGLCTRVVKTVITDTLHKSIVSLLRTFYRGGFCLARLTNL